MRFELSIPIIVFISLYVVTQSTSNYKGVSWDEKRKLWQAEFYFNDKKSISYFANELDAAKKINQLYENMKIHLKITKPPPEIFFPQKKEIATQVYWNKKKQKCQSQLRFSEGKLKYGENFNDELYAAKRWNQLCEEMEISSQNSETICPIPTQKKKQIKNLDHLFEEMRIFSRNSGFYAIPTQQYKKRKKTSQYQGVYWNKEKQKWYVQLFLKAKRLYGGVFDDEMDAANKVNELCKKLGIPPLNSGINTISNQGKEEKISQYQGVYWHMESGKWYAHLSLNSEKHNWLYGGIFDEELDAAKKVNQLREEFETPSLTPKIHNFNFLSLPPIKK